MKEFGIGNAEVGMRNAEWKTIEHRAEDRMRKSECGMRNGKAKDRGQMTDDR